MSNKPIPLLGMLLCGGSLAIAYFYFQLRLGLPPCPLCILDRWVLGAIGLGFFFLLFNSPILNPSARLWNWLFLLIGFTVGGRHLWLEYFPTENASSCIPQSGGLGLVQWLTNAFVGTADCSLVLWSFLGLSLAGWTFVLYIALSILMLFKIKSA